MYRFAETWRKVRSSIVTAVTEFNMMAKIRIMVIMFKRSVEGWGGGGDDANNNINIAYTKT